MAGSAWEQWSEADQVPLTLQAAAVGKRKVKLGMQDTWKLRGGIHYKWNDAWTLMTGVSYDSSPLDGKDRIAALPLDEQIRLGVGVIHQLSDDLQFSTGFEWLHLGSADISQANLQGKYDQNEIFFLMFNLNFKKLPWSGMGTF
jgi:long-subunit fatty acid transport protein